MCRPSIDMRSKEKLYPLLRAFQWYVACHLHARKSGRFLTFSGRESNLVAICVATPLLEDCEDDIHTPKMGTAELDCRGQNTSH